MVSSFTLTHAEADHAISRLYNIKERRKSGEIESNQFISLQGARLNQNARQEENNDDNDEFGSNDMTIFDKLSSEDYKDFVLFFSFEFTSWTSSLEHLQLDFNFF